MVRIGDVWDSTTDVLAGRAGPLAALAGAGLLLPAVLKAALSAWLARPAGGTSVVVALATLVFALIALGARLAITAVALDPDTTIADARGRAVRRLPSLVGALLVIGAGGIVLVVPLLVLVTRAGFDWTALSAGGRPPLPQVTGGALWFAWIYVLALAALALWVVARVKLLLNPVVLAERRTIGAIGRAAALSRGMTWPLIGVVLLYYVVLWVCLLAATSVAGIVFRLSLGAGPLTGFLATVIGAAVGALLDTVAQVFGARLYAASTGGGGAARAAA